jgi:hypothetical protein
MVGEYPSLFLLGIQFPSGIVETTNNAEYTILIRGKPSQPQGYSSTFPLDWLGDRICRD